MTLVVDSSVVLKWYVEEPGSERAGGLIGSALVAPDLVVAEVANALWRKVLGDEIGAAQAVAVLPHLQRTVLLHPSADLAEPALDAALALRHPAHDCFFLVLAEMLDTELITADARLIERCRDSRFDERVRRL